MGHFLKLKMEYFLKEAFLANPGEGLLHFLGDLEINYGLGIFLQNNNIALLWISKFHNKFD